MASKRHLRVASDVQLKVAAEKGHKVVASLHQIAKARRPPVVCDLLSSSRQQLIASEGQEGEEESRRREEK